MKKVLIALFIISMLLLVGCKEEPEAAAPAPPLETPEPIDENFVEPDDLNVDVEDIVPDEEQSPEPESEPEPEPQEPFCGDGTCDDDENCDRCAKDCACKSPAECHNGECVVPECGGDGDCKDDDACTIDTCFFAQHPNAYCGHDLVKKCKNNDDCCPKGCDGNTDSDCESVCDNGVCEPGETSSNCEEDCQQAPAPFCGDANCDLGEDRKTCPADCI